MASDSMNPLCYNSQWAMNYRSNVISRKHATASLWMMYRKKSTAILVKPWRRQRNLRRRSGFCLSSGACSRPRPTQGPTSSSVSSTAECSRRPASRGLQRCCCRLCRRRCLCWIFVMINLLQRYLHEIRYQTNFYMYFCCCLLFDPQNYDYVHGIQLYIFLIIVKYF